MCKGLDDLMARHRREGKAEERAYLVKKKLAKGHSVEQIADALETTVDDVQDIMKKLHE